jgi:myo-inositol-1(or 4)-monophosphatase
MNVHEFLNDVKLDIVKNIDKVASLRNGRSIKLDQSFVTEGDLLINSIIENKVMRSGERISFVSEESSEQKTISDEGYIIVVDPLDGTENFTSGLPEWGVSISCFQNQKHVGSLLGCPEMNLWLKSGDAVPRYFSRIRGLSSSLNKDELIQATQGHEYRILGCCVYNMINVIRGSFLSFENPKGAHSWDILGGLNLALENNLKVTVDGKQYAGEYLQANRKYKFRVEH